MTPLSSERIRLLLNITDLAQTIHILDETTSTNTEAFAFAHAGASHGTIVLAETQTAGRGRLTREWFSPPLQNIYGSILLKNVPPPQRISWIPLITGLAIMHAVEKESGVALFLKWPNDLLVGNRTIAGILCDSPVQGKETWTIVVGFGLNVHTPIKEFPLELQPIATSLFAETGHHEDRNQLLAAILSNFSMYYRKLQRSDLSTVKDLYVSRCSTLGHHVQIRLANGKMLEGIASDIGADGALQLLPANTHTMNCHELIDIQSGEVISVR